MYLIKKAMKNLLNNKGRNILMFIMLFMVTLASVVSLTIYNTTMKVKVETENYYAGEVSITQDKSPVTSPTIEDYKQYIDSDYLRSYVIYKSIPVSLESIKLLDGDYEDPEGNVRRMVDANSHVYGMVDEHSMDEFTYGDRKITEGKIPANIEECMISSELAELNNLHIGDTLQLTIAITKIKKELKISGIFSDATVARSNNDFHAPLFNRRNDVITSYEFLDQIPNTMLDYKTFLLKDSADLNAFQNELYDKGLSKSLYLKYDTDRYDEAVEGINEMLLIVTQFFGIVAFIGIGIVFLINVLALRERKYEIGVLRAIGMSKFKVMTLLMSEMLILALFSSVIALLAGIFVNPSAVNVMKRVTLGGHLPSPLMSEILGLKASLSGIVIMEVILLSILLVLIAGSMTIASITRFDPVKILSERN